ncbi:RNA polymerase sigma factor [Paenibacillus puldeungensis]|uniref:RNA polymerase sigma factor n=1 Tax=Paenibacillus puldeungensis TaxID=696536 RepID=A0ABW3S4C9_9BACL
MPRISVKHRTLDRVSDEIDFSAWIQTQQEALRRYCRQLAGSAWEGDDLAQDTWLKVWSVARGRNGITISRAYLYRTARNAWIDRHRKKQILADSWPTDELPDPQIDTVTVWSAMETLVKQLTSSQRVALLLVDIFEYTAAEAAELIQTTEGAVKAALHRARVKLRSSLGRSEHVDRKLSGTSQGPKGHDDFNQDIVYAYMEAFRQQDTMALAMLFNANQPQELIPTMTLQSYRRNKRNLVSGLHQSHHSSHSLMVMTLAA